MVAHRTAGNLMLLVAARDQHCLEPCIDLAEKLAFDRGLQNERRTPQFRTAILRTRAKKVSLAKVEAWDCAPLHLRRDLLALSMLCSLAGDLTSDEPRAVLRAR